LGSSGFAPRKRRVETMVGREEDEARCRRVEVWA
jgi:hypothetical protein